MVATGRAERDPTADLRGVVKKPKAEHFAAITSPAEVGGIADDGRLQGHAGGAVRAEAGTSGLCPSWRATRAQWAEIDFEREEWRIPAERMKRRREHMVPLSPGPAILKDLHPLTGIASMCSSA